MGLKIDTIANKPETNAGNSRKSFLDREITLFSSRFSNSAKEDFYGELSVLLQSGIKLQSALELIEGIQKKKKNVAVVADICENVVKGDSFSEALKKRMEFSTYEYQAIRIGEQAGELPKIIDDLRAYFNRKNELRRQLTTSLSYPVIILMLVIVVVWFMLKFVVPIFVDIFKQNRVELPLITQKIIQLSNMVNEYGWAILLATIGLTILLRTVRKKNSYRKFIGNLQLRLPIFGNYIRKLYLIQFTQAMALLTYARIPIINGLQMVREMIQFHPLQQSLEEIEADIVRGSRIDESFAKHSLYDKKMIALLKVAEETNQTEFIFQKLYEQYSTELSYKGKLLSTTLNFILTLIVGLIVGVILVAMYLPMFKLSSLLG